MLRSPISACLARLYERHRNVTEGAVANYIPELAKADPNWFGICIATRDGHFYEIGDTRQKFTIQSISKALSYGLALEDCGESHVLSRIGVEPSGDAFNAISLNAGSGAPFNPMINAGAIATCGQIKPHSDATRIDRIRRYLSACAGRMLDIDEAVYRSESETGHRNRAIGWMLRNFGIIDEDPHDILETYFQQCSLLVTCRDLAFMGATLANQGVNPFTRERAIKREYVDNILSVMATCGMYDYSGEWIYRVGLPAKSGVGGGIIAVLPGQLGIGVYSPLLDARGNSVRGIRVCEDLAKEFHLHLFNPSAAPPPARRCEYDASTVQSKRRRPLQAAVTLRNYGSRIRVIELQGELIFSTVEPVLRELVRQAPYARRIILDCRRVTGMNAISLQLLQSLAKQLRESEPAVRMVYCNAAPFQRDLTAAGALPEELFPDTDAALEAAEDDLLSELCGLGWQPPEVAELAQCNILRGCPPEDIEWLREQLPLRKYQAGESIVHSGDEASEVFIITSGSVEVRLRIAAGSNSSRVDVFSAGMSFGEMAFLDRSPRSADVVALEACECRVITQDFFATLERSRPALRFTLLASIAQQVSANLRHANRELAAMRG